MPAIAVTRRLPCRTHAGAGSGDVSEACCGADRERVIRPVDRAECCERLQVVLSRHLSAACRGMQYADVPDDDRHLGMVCSKDVNLDSQRLGNSI